MISPTTGDSIFVPKGTNAICILGYSCYTSSDDPRLGWKGSNVEAFRPERWLVENGAFDINAGPSIPFASGPRSCFGAKMAVSCCYALLSPSQLSSLIIASPMSTRRTSQLLFLRLFTAHLSLAFFLEPLPDTHKTNQCVAFVTRRPKKNWVGVREWVEDEGVVLMDDRS